MFIAVIRYKHDKHILPDTKIAVFDSSDCTVELVTYDEAYDNGVGLHNIVRNKVLKYPVIGEVGLKTALGANHGDYVTYFEDRLEIGKRRINIGISNKALRINGAVVNDWFNGYLVYCFFYTEYLVMRFRVLPHSAKQWFSVAVGVDGLVASSWDSNMEKTYNKSLAFRIDLISEV